MLESIDSTCKMKADKPSMQLNHSLSTNNIKISNTHQVYLTPQTTYFITSQQGTLKFNNLVKHYSNTSLHILLQITSNDIDTDSAVNQ